MTTITQPHILATATRHEGHTVNARITDRIRVAATSLGLTNTAETITEALARAEAGQLGYLDFLDQVLAEEITVKDTDT